MTVSAISQEIEFPVLVADIGGTNARFSIVESAAHATQAIGQTETASHKTFEDAAQTIIAENKSPQPRTAIIAVAGPVTGDCIRLTNAEWLIMPLAAIEKLKLKSVFVLNDFEAQALALPHLGRQDLISLGGPDEGHKATKFVLGPGTGLGAAAMIYSCGKWIPVPGEGGHVELAPVSKRDYNIWPHIERIGGRIGAEQILCGSGLLRLTKAVLAERQEHRTFQKPADLVEAADNDDPIALEVMDIFCAALGRIAGDFALTTLAKGGIYLAGGIPPKISKYLLQGNFRKNFEAKAPHDAIMRQIPTFIVDHPNPALEGLAVFARNPDEYLVDIQQRHWSI
ncbi:glucokinase [Flexibacterium corallicola]|uniref:glucokinase n=1 Tax=Flexibacterium corallicola TaxID=3037259 RepID=UPI00286FA017|nr:glucokinase [Pseudovibrio sp. M1P-2-3]